MERKFTDILIVDNYDSFTYNIAHSIRVLPDVKLQIIKANDIDTGAVDMFDKIIFSPGPDLPRPGNVMERILDRYQHRKKILGICLGLQAIYLYYGGKLRQLENVVHGEGLEVIKKDEGSSFLKAAQLRFTAGLYHSWLADETTIPSVLKVTAETGDGRIMGIRHRTLDIEAVQFHPESILTPEGDILLRQWADAKN